MSRRHDPPRQETTEDEQETHPCPYCTRSYPTRERLVNHSEQAHGKHPIERRKVAVATLVGVLVLLALAVAFYLL